MEVMCLWLPERCRLKATARLAFNAPSATRLRYDAAIEEQLGFLAKSEGRATNVGLLFAQAVVDGAYSRHDLKAEAARVYRFRTRASGPPTSSELAQASKLSSFAKAGLGWKGGGIKLVTHA